MSRVYMGIGGTGGIRTGLLADQREYMDERSETGFLPDKEAIELRFAALAPVGCRESSE